MKNAAGILLVIYLFFLVPLLAGAFIDAAAGVKKRNISSTYANGFVAMLGIFWGVAVLFLYRGCTLEKLSMVWMLATITICVASILANKKAIHGCFKHKRKSENGNAARYVFDVRQGCKNCNGSIHNSNIVFCILHKTTDGADSTNSNDIN